MISLSQIYASQQAIEPGKRLVRLARFYVKADSGAFSYEKIQFDGPKYVNNPDKVGKKVNEQLKKTCMEFHLDLNEPFDDSPIQSFEKYEKAFLDAIPVSMSMEDLNLRKRHVAIVKNEYLDALGKLETLQMDHEPNAEGEDKVSVLISISKGDVDRCYAAWNTGQTAIDTHLLRVAKSRQDSQLLAIKQHGEDCDAFVRFGQAKINVKKVLQQILSSCPPQIKYLLSDLENDGTDPYLDNNFYVLVKRLDKRFGVPDEIGTTALLVQSFNTGQGTLSLAEYRNLCNEIMVELFRAIPSGSISLENLVATIILRGMDPVYLSKYLTTMAQVNLSRTNMGTESDHLPSSNNPEEDDMSTIGTTTRTPMNMLTCVQNFMDAEIKKQFSSKTMESISYTNSGFKRSTLPSSSTPLVVCPVTPTSIETAATKKLNLLSKFNVCPQEYHKQGSCALGSKCPAFHLRSGTNFCGLHLEGKCDKGTMCFRSHELDLRSGTTKSKDVGRNNNISSKPSAASQQLFPISMNDDPNSFMCTDIADIYMIHTSYDSASPSYRRTRFRQRQFLSNRAVSERLSDDSGIPELLSDDSDSDESSSLQSIPDSIPSSVRDVISPPCQRTRINQQQVFFNSEIAFISADSGSESDDASSLQSIPSSISVSHNVDMSVSHGNAADSSGHYSQVADAVQNYIASDTTIDVLHAFFYPVRTLQIDTTHDHGNCAFNPLPDLLSDSDTSDSERLSPLLCVNPLNSFGSYDCHPSSSPTSSSVDHTIMHMDALPTTYNALRFPRAGTNQMPIPIVCIAPPVESFSIFTQLQDLSYGTIRPDPHHRVEYTKSFNTSCIISFITNVANLVNRNWNYDRMLMLRTAFRKTTRDLGSLLTVGGRKSIQAYLIYISNDINSTAGLEINASLHSIDSTIRCRFGMKFYSYLVNRIGKSFDGRKFADVLTMELSLDSAYHGVVCGRFGSLHSQDIQHHYFFQDETAFTSHSLNDDQHILPSDVPFVSYAQDMMPIVFPLSVSNSRNDHGFPTNGLYLPYLLNTNFQCHIPCSTSITIALCRFYHDIIYGDSSHINDSAFMSSDVVISPAFRDMLLSEGMRSHHAPFWNCILDEDSQYSLSHSTYESFFDDVFIATFRTYYGDLYSSDDLIVSILCFDCNGFPDQLAISMLYSQVYNRYHLPLDPPLVLMLHVTSSEGDSDPLLLSPSAVLVTEPSDLAVSILPDPFPLFLPVNLPIPMPAIPVDLETMCYVAPSSLRCFNRRTNTHSSLIGQGLFASNGFGINDIVALFDGEVISMAMMRQRTAAGVGGNMVLLSRQRVLDCTRDDPTLQCHASFANSPLHCIDSHTNLPAVANCRLVQGTRNRPSYLRALRPIPMGTEILYCYGSSYLMPIHQDEVLDLIVPVLPVVPTVPTIVSVLPSVDVVGNDMPNEDAVTILALQNQIHHLERTIRSLTYDGSVHNPIDLTIDDAMDSLPTSFGLSLIPIDYEIPLESDLTPSILSVSTIAPVARIGWDSLSGIHVVGTSPIPFPLESEGPRQALGIGGVTNILEHGICPDLDDSLIFHRIEGNSQNLISIGLVLQPSLSQPDGGVAIFTQSGAVRFKLTDRYQALLTALLDEVESEANIIAHAILERNVYYQTTLPIQCNPPFPSFVANVQLYGGRIRTTNGDQLISFLAATGISKMCLIDGINNKTILGLPPHLSTSQIDSYFATTGKNKYQLTADITLPALRHPIDYNKIIPRFPGEYLDIDGIDPSYSRLKRLIIDSTPPSEMQIVVPPRRGPLVVIPSINGGFKDAVLAYDPCSGYVSIKGRISTASPHLILTHYVDLWYARWMRIHTVRTDSAFVTVLSKDILSKRIPPITILQAPPGDHRRVTSAAEGIIRWVQQGGQANMNRLQPLVRDNFITDEIARSFWFYATLQSTVTLNLNPALHDKSITRFECGTGNKANLSYQVLLPFGLPIIGKSPEPHADGRGEEGLYLGPSTIVPSGIIFFSLRTHKISIKFAFLPSPKPTTLTQRDVSHISSQLYGSSITLTSGVSSSSLDSFASAVSSSTVPPLSHTHITRSKSGSRDHMHQVLYLTTAHSPIYLVHDDFITDLRSRGPKPPVPSNKVCMHDPAWHAADDREISKLNAEETLFPLPVDVNGRYIRPAHAIVLPLLRVREYKWKPDPLTAISRWLECVRLVINGSRDDRVLGDYYAHTPDRTIFLLITSLDCSLLRFIMTGDVERAYLNALSLDTNIVVLAPPDIKGLPRESLLNKGLYGSRKAALGWEGWIEEKLVAVFHFLKLDVARGVYLHYFQANRGECSNTSEDFIVSNVASPVTDLVKYSDTQSLLPDSISLVDLHITSPSLSSHRGNHMKLLRHSDDFYSSASDAVQQQSMHVTIESNIRMSPFCNLSKFLGCDFIRYSDQGVLDPLQGSIVLVYQKDFINEMIIKFKYLREIFNPTSRKRNHPVPVNAIMSDEELEGDRMNLLNHDQIRMYQEVVGSINWLACSTRPECKFGCFIVARQLVSPRNWDMYLAIHIIDFIIDTINVPLVLGGPIIDPILYADASFAPLPDRKSICSHLVLSGSGSGCIYAHVSAPKCAVTSIFEAELIAGNNAATTAVYITKACQEMGYDVSNQRTIYIDNEAEIHWISGSVSNKRSKHVDIRLYASRHLQDQGHVLFMFVDTKNQLADLITKALSVPLFRPSAFILLGHGLIKKFNLIGVELYE